MTFRNVSQVEGGDRDGGRDPEEFCLTRHVFPAGLGQGATISTM